MFIMVELERKAAFETALIDVGMTLVSNILNSPWLERCLSTTGMTKVMLKIKWRMKNIENFRFSTANWANCKKKNYRTSFWYKKWCLIDIFEEVFPTALVVVQTIMYASCIFLYFKYVVTGKCTVKFPKESLFSRIESSIQIAWESQKGEVWLFAIFRPLLNFSFENLLSHRRNAIKFDIGKN